MAAQERNLRTASETLFEEYLAERGLPFDYEKPYRGKSKRIDYTVPIDGRDFLFEVRELDPRRAGAESGIVDEYAAIRQKITNARQRFREYSEYPCCLVLYDCDPLRPIFLLPDVMLGAMYGDLWWTGAVLD